MATIKIEPNTPLYGVTNLLNYIQKRSKYSKLDWEISENPSSGFISAFSEDLSYVLIGNNTEVYKLFYLPYGGEEFSENDYLDIDYHDLHPMDQEYFLNYLRYDIRTDEACNYADELDEAEQELEDAISE